MTEFTDHDTSSSNADEAGQPHPKPNSYVEFESFGQLLANLESSERAFQANTRVAERQEAKYGSVAAFASRLQAAALLFQPDPARMPGVDRIEALVNEAYGSKLTAESIRKLRGTVCHLLRCGTQQADELTMQQAADILETGGQTQASESPLPFPIGQPTNSITNVESMNLAILQTLIEKAAEGANASRMALTQIAELPEIELLAEQLGLSRPGEFSLATVKAIVSRLCRHGSISQQEAYRLPLHRVVASLRELAAVSQKEVVMPDARNVFVIHGRNNAARNAMFDFLRAVGLNPIEWSEAVRMTGKGSPYIGEILDAAFSNAQAVVAILTGDDLAHLREEFQEGHDASYEKTPTPQARPNVLFEAGMAFGRHAERTIMVEIGNLRPFSDAAGRHTIQFRDTVENRHDLRGRLKTAGCAVKEEGTDWLKSGNFAEALRMATVHPLPGRKKT